MIKSYQFKTLSLNDGAVRELRRTWRYNFEIAQSAQHQQLFG